MTPTHPFRVSSAWGRIGLAVASLSGIFSGVLGQPPSPVDVRPTAASNSDCAKCHSCDQPTTTDACLRSCTRARAAAQKPKGLKPDLVLLDQLEDRYLPVPFDHEGHAEMAEMTRGCATCHHYTPEGTEHPACKTCHEVASARVDIRKPGLKGAYHRQCLNCHREWSDDDKCDVCHRPKTGTARGSAAGPGPTPDDIVGRMHPPIPEPDTDVFHPRGGTQAGTKVVFYHKEHIHRFGLACVECHHEDNCSRCHNASAATAPRTPGLAGHHQPCMKCHDTSTPQGCVKCHWEEGKPPPPRFDHASTGFPLSRYHNQKSCRACHAAVPFAKLSTQCTACHADWTTADFDHAVTGQRLSDTHARLDCEGCHLERAFERSPTCGECHEPEEGITFPARRPGERTSGGGP